MCKIFETVKSALVGSLTSLDRPYAADLHGYLYTPSSDTCGATNTVVSIMGYELLGAIYGNTEYFADKWSKQLSDDDLAAMLTLAETWFEENPEGLHEIWQNLEI